MSDLIPTCRATVGIPRLSPYLGPARGKWERLVDVPFSLDIFKIMIRSSAYMRGVGRANLFGRAAAGRAVSPGRSVPLTQQVLPDHGLILLRVSGILIHWTDPNKSLRKHSTKKSVVTRKVDGRSSTGHTHVPAIHDVVLVHDQHSLGWTRYSAAITGRVRAYRRTPT